MSCRRFDNIPCNKSVTNTGVGTALLIETSNPNEIKGLTSLDSSVVITDNTTSIDLSVSTPVADTNIYDIDGILAGNRTLTGNNFDLNFLGLNSFTLTGQDSHSISTSGPVIQLQNTNTTGLIQLITTQNTSNISVVSAGDLEAYGYSVSNFGRNAVGTLTNIWGEVVTMPNIANISTADILHYNSATKSITYGALPVVSINPVPSASGEHVLSNLGGGVFEHKEITSVGGSIILDSTTVPGTLDFSINTSGFTNAKASSARIEVDPTSNPDPLTGGLLIPLNPLGNEFNIPLRTASPGSGLCEAYIDDTGGDYTVGVDTLTINNTGKYRVSFNVFVMGSVDQSKYVMLLYNGTPIFTGPPGIACENITGATAPGALSPYTKIWSFSASANIDVSSVPVVLALRILLDNTTDDNVLSQCTNLSINRLDAIYSGLQGATGPQGPPGAVQNTIYNADDVLTGNRNVSGAGTFDLNFNTMPNFNVTTTTSANITSPVTNLGQSGAFNTNLYGQNLYLQDIPSSTTANVLYYDNATKLVTYGAVPAGSNIYNSDGVLTGARILNGGTFPLTFNNMPNFNLNTTNSINCSTSAASSSINLIAGGNASSINIITTGATGSASFYGSQYTSVGRSGPYFTNIFGQNLYLQDIASSTQSNILYYNSGSKLVTYAPAPTIPSYVCFNYASTSTATITGLFPSASDTTMIGSIINQVDFTSVSGGSEVQYNGATSKGFRLKFSASVIQTVPANQEIRVSLILNGGTPISTTLTRTYNPGLTSGYFYIACLETIQFISTGQRIGVGWGRQSSNTALNINNATLIIESI